MFIKTLLISLPVFAAFAGQSSYAATQSCVFAPTETRVGQSGAKEAYLIVCNGSECYNLGLGTDDQARNRYSTALTALVSGKQLQLTFYNRTCTQAQADFVTPTGTRLLAD